VILGLAHGMGKIKKVQINLFVGFLGAFVWLKSRLDVNKKLSRFVSITRDEEGLLP
jgi:hypothetical protein